MQQTPSILEHVSQALYMMISLNHLKLIHGIVNYLCTQPWRYKFMVHLSVVSESLKVSL